MKGNHREGSQEGKLRAGPICHNSVDQQKLPEEGSLLMLLGFVFGCVIFRATAPRIPTILKAATLKVIFSRYGLVAGLGLGLSPFLYWFGVKITCDQASKNSCLGLLWRNGL